MAASLADLPLCGLFLIPKGTSLASLLLDRVDASCKLWVTPPGSSEVACVLVLNARGDCSAVAPRHMSPTSAAWCSVGVQRDLGSSLCF